jgi:hypothetical protein
MATNIKYATTLSSQLTTGPITDYDFATGAYVPAAATPTLTVSEVSISADTGVSQSDFITRTAEQTITGKMLRTLSGNQQLWGSLDNGATWTDITDKVSGKSISWDHATLSGSSAIVFRIIDAAGNESARTSGQAYVLDQSINNLTAVLANDTGTSASDRRTSDATVNIGGLEKNAAWQYSTDNGDTWKQGHGTSIAASVFKTGDNTLMVKQTDKAGNESGTSSLNFTLYAKIATPTLALAADTGTANDAITKNCAITVGNLEEGTRWKYSLDNGSTWKNGNGTSIESSVFKSNGEYTVLVKQADRAGNESRTSSLSFTRDATVAAPTVALFHDTGASATDQQTSDGTLRVTGIEDGATWQYNIDNTGWKTGSGGYIKDNLFSAGYHNVSVKQTDIAGNTKQTNYSFTLESTKPQVVLYKDSGASDHDNITNASSLYITGLNGHSLTYSINGAKAVELSKTASSFGSSAFKEGVNTITYSVDSKGGNNLNTTYTFTLDTIDPNAPSLALISDTGSSRSDRVTSRGAVQINGLETGATWKYSVNDGSWITGRGTSVSSSAFSEGANKVKVQQTDLAGNQGKIAELNFTLDTKAPAAPKIALNSDTGFSARDNITSDGSIKIMGIEAGASWWYSLTNTSGSWVKGTGNVLSTSVLGSDGAKTVYVRQVDSADKVSNTASLSFTLDTTADKAPVLSLAHDTGSSNTDAVTNDGTVAISGIASGSTWQCNINNGGWIADGNARSLAANLFHEGGNIVIAKVRDAAGNESIGAIGFTLDTKCAPSLALLHDTGNSDRDKVTSDATVVVSGIEDVASWRYQTDQSTDWVVGEGNQIAASAFIKGVNTVHVQATDRAGNAGTADLTFTLNPDCGPMVALKNDTGVSNSDKITQDGTVHFTFSPGSSPFAWYEYSVNGSQWVRRERSNSDQTSYAEGKNIFRVREIHSDGSVGETSTFTFTLDTTPPEAPSPSLVNITQAADRNHIDSTYDGTIKVTGLDPEARHYWCFYGNKAYGFAEGTSSGVEFLGDTISSSAFTFGVHGVNVYQVDSAGNQSKMGPMIFYLWNWVDDSPLSLANDTGSSKSDNVTNDATVNIKDFGDKISWEYSLDNGGDWIKGSGHSIAANVFHEGVNTVHLRIKDIYAYDYINGTAELTFTLDTQKPSAPNVYLLHDTGTSNSDNLTSDGTVVVDGLEEGATWTFHSATTPGWFTGGTIWDDEAHVTRNQIPASYITEGSNAVYIQTTDKAGNKSDISSLTFDVDYKTPAVFLANDAGSSNHDFITNDATVSVVRHDDSANYEWSLDGATWKVGNGPTLSKDIFHEGVNLLQVRETFDGGRIGNITELTFTLDTKAPEIPNYAIFHDRIEISGLESGATWYYNVDHETEMRQGQGNSIPASVLSEGEHHIFVMQQDVAGNYSHTNQFDVSNLDFSDNWRPMAVSLLNDAGSSNHDNITNDATVSVVRHNNSTNYEYSLDGGATWNEGQPPPDSPPTPKYISTISKGYFHEGLNALQVRETFDDGKVGDITYLNFTLDTQAPETPDITKLSDKIEISGLEPGATWFYNVDSETGQGQGTSIAANVLSEGEHHIFVYQQDLAGNFSHTNNFDITVYQSHIVL